MIEIIRRIYEFIKYRFGTKTKYFVIDLDEQDKKVVFLCYGSRAFFEKKLFELPANDHLITGLDPRQSCYLGIRTGELMDVEMDKFLMGVKTNAKTTNIYDSKKGVDITIDRYGNTMYFDPTTKALECAPAIDLVKNDQILLRLTPDASYAIGLFVGKSIRKKYIESAMSNNTLVASNIINIAAIKNDRGSKQ